MSTIESIIARASELSVDDRLTIAMQLLELVRDTLDGGKGKKGGKKTKKSKKSDAAADSDTDSVKEKKTREPTKWTTGLAAIRPILEKNGINKKLAMKIGSKLKDLPSWPAPSEKEVVDASNDLDADV
jgi:hypothetical protein